MEAQQNRPWINDTISGRAATGLNDKTFALDAAQAEASMENSQKRIAELSVTLDRLRLECSTFTGKAEQFDIRATELEAEMAAALRSGGDVDSLALSAASERSKAKASRQAAEQAHAEFQRTEIARNFQGQNFDTAEKNRAGILLRAKAQEFAREVTKIRPLVNELQKLASLAGISLHEGVGLLPNFAIPEVAGIRFDLSGI